MYLKTILLACLCISSAFGIDMNLTISQLGSDDYAARQTARLALQQSLAEATTPGADSADLRTMEAELIAQLSGSLPLSERLYLIRMLELFGTADSAQSLYPLLGDTEPEVRDSARRALSVLPGEAATSYLVAGLSRAPVEQRAAYVDALVYRDAASAAPEIAALLQSSDVELVRAAALALGKLGDESVMTDLLLARDAAASEEQKYLLEAALLDLGIDADTAYLLAGQGSNVAIRAGAFAQLCTSDSKRAIAVLKSVLSKPDFEGADRFLAEAMRHDITQKYLVGALPTAMQDDQIIIVAAIGELGLSQYEGQLIALADGQSGRLHAALLDALSRIGGDASFKPINDVFARDPQNYDWSVAMSRLRAPAADKYALEAAQNSSDLKARATAIRMLELRNTAGATELLNTIAAQPGDTQVREAAIQSLEAIGDFASIQIMVNLIVTEDAQARAAQRSLKRLAPNLNAADLIWEQAFVPALESASSDAARDGLIVIADAVAGEQSLAYLRGLAIDPTASLHSSALRALERWPNLASGKVWIELAGTPQMPEVDITTAEKTLKKMLSKNDHSQDEQQLDLAVLVLQKGPTLEFKQAILEVYETPNPRQTRHIKSGFKPFENDPDLGATIQLILSRL